MSRLESFIRRLEAQRACIDAAAAAAGPGLVAELGLGNGRTFDHLRERLPGRRILVLEREPNPHALSTPPEADLIIGPLAETLPATAADHAGRFAMIHSDIGCGDPRIDAMTAALVARHAPAMLAEGGWLVSDQPVETAALKAQPLPAVVAPGRYYMYRRDERA